MSLSAYERVLHIWLKEKKKLNLIIVQDMEIVDADLAINHVNVNEIKLYAINYKWTNEWTLSLSLFVFMCMQRIIAAHIDSFYFSTLCVHTPIVYDNAAFGQDSIYKQMRMRASSFFPRIM